MKNLTDMLSSFKKRREALAPEEEVCLACGQDLAASEHYLRYRVCPSCGFHYNVPAHVRVNMLADPSTFREVRRTLASLDPLRFAAGVSYKRRIFEAQRRTGLTDAVLTGTCTIGGNETVLAVLDFGFLGGSMGCVVGEKIALAFELAAKRKLPLVTVVASAGVRMQEGILSLMQMAKTAAAARLLDAAGMPYISVFANPTTGGVYASFANLGDAILAEPGALMGYAALRQTEEATGHPLPEGAHTAEDHLRHGLIDHVVERPRLREMLSVLLDLLGARYRLTATKKGGRYETPGPPREAAWQTVQLARHEQRPTARDYVHRIASSFVELRGDRCTRDDPAIFCGVADLAGQAVMIVGQQRDHEDQHRVAGPEGFRKAQRALRLATKFGLPVIALIDTRGADASLPSEERGIGNAIGGTMALLSNLPTPVVSAVIGEGGSEGALALGVADRILMLENAIYSVISPEGAASILYRNPARAEELAPTLKLTARDCRELGVVDMVVPEPQGGAHADPDEAARLLRGALVAQLLEIQAQPMKKVMRTRYAKFRRMGLYNYYLNTAVARELAELQEFLSRRVEDVREHLPRRKHEPEPPEEEDLQVP